MAAPVLSVTTDKQSYQPGEKITVTAVYSDPDAKQVTISGAAVDSQGNSTPASVVIQLNDPVTVSVSDGDGRQWTKVSDTGSTAVFTATA